MKRLTLLLMFAAALGACNNKSAPAVDLAKEHQALLDADKDFCATEMQDGWGKAAAKYYDDNVIAISPNQPVSLNKAALLKASAGTMQDSMKSLNWKAEQAVVAASGDLGYVWGYYHIAGKTKAGTDTTWYGAYSTIYKKTDAGWKAVVDINADTPKP